MRGLALGLACLATLACVLALPAGFNDEVILNVNEVMSIVNLDDHRILAAKRDGNILIVDWSTKPAQTASYLVLPVDSYGERGCMSIILDPDFATNNYFYVYYSSIPGGGFRVSRFEHSNNNGGTSSRADQNSEVLIWDDPDGYIGPYHYGGDISFGPDEHIYISLGDKYYAQLAQDMSYTAGKVIRVSKTGAFPSDNLGLDDGVGGIHDGIWAVGMRNGYRSRWDLATNRYFIAEVGGNNQAVAQEDIHLGAARKNFGWPLCEGACDSPDFAYTCNCNDYDDPIFHYTHTDSNAPTGSNAAIVGGFVNWGSHLPQEYYGAYFFADYSRGWMKYLKFEADGKTVASENMFDNYMTSVINFEPALDGSFFYSTLNQIRHITYSSGNQYPVIYSAWADPATGSAPLSVTFDVSAFDEDGDALTYTWTLGNGQVLTGKSVSTTYYSEGTYTAYVTVADAEHQVVSDDIKIEVGIPPVVNILSPSPSMKFVANQVLEFDCQGQSGSTGAYLPNSAHTWGMILLHDDHTHPAVNDHVGSTMTFTIPSEGHGFMASVGYRATCTVEHNGLIASKSIELWPDEVYITIATQPVDLGIFFDGIASNAPFTTDTMIGFYHLISAQESVCKDGVLYRFASWSHVSGNEHTITVPGQDTTYTASYYTDGSCIDEVPVSNGLVMHLKGDEGVVTDSSGYISEWQDLSGSNNLSPPAGASAPLLLAGQLNGHSVVTFDGDTEALGADSASGLPLGNSARTVFVVVKYDSPGWGGFSWGESGCKNVFGLTVGAGQGYLFIEDYCGSPSAEMGNGEDWMIHSAVYDGSTLEHMRDGEVIETLSGGSTGYGTADTMIRLGVEINDGVNVKAQYAEVIVFNRALSSSEMDSVHEYLHLKYFDEGNTIEEVKLTFSTSPVGVPVTIEGHEQASPALIETQPGAPVQVSVPQSYCQGNTLFAFDQWTISSSPSFELLAPGVDTTYTASFTPTGSCGTTTTTTTQGPSSTTSAETTTTTTTTSPSTGNNEPPVTAGLVMRLNSQQGLVAAGNGDVSTWEDQTGNGNDLQSLVGTGKPTVVSGQLNGHGVVSFDGSDDALGRDGVNNIPTGNADRSLFLVVKYESAGWGGLSFGSVGCNAMYGATVTSSVGELFVDTYCSGSAYASGTLGLDAGWLIQQVIIKDQQLHHYKDNTLLETLDASGLATTGAKIVMGAEHNLNSKVKMSVADVMVFDRAVSGSERQQLVAYLEARYLSDATPVYSAVTFDSTPSGLDLVVDGEAQATPVTLTYLSGTEVTVEAPAVQCTDSDVKYTFGAWNSGYAQATQTFTVGDADVSVIAAYSNTGSCSTGSDELPVQLGLVMQLDADDITDVSGSGSVNVWPDAVHGNGLSVPASLSKPSLVVNGLNSKAFVSFDGAGNALGRDDIGALPSGSADRTIVMVVKYDSAGWGGFTYGSAGCLQAFGPAVSVNLGQLMVENYCTNDDVQSGVSGQGAGWMVQTVVLKSNVMSHYKDQELIESYTLGYLTAADGHIRMGVEINDWSKLDMDVAAVAAWDRALESSERQQVVDHFKSYYGLA